MNFKKNWKDIYE